MSAFVQLPARFIRMSPEFLESYSLYQKTTFERTFNQDDPIYSGYKAIHISCTHCKTDRTFAYELTPSLFHNQVQISSDLVMPIAPEYSPFAGGRSLKGKHDNVFYLCYRCSYCKIGEFAFFIWTSAD